MIRFKNPGERPINRFIDGGKEGDLIESFVTLVMKTREVDGRAERGNNGG